MKTAIVHDWLVNYGGAERVVEQMLLLYPDADIYTLVYDEKRWERFFQKKKSIRHRFRKFLWLKNYIQSF